MELEDANVEVQLLQMISQHTSQRLSRAMDQVAIAETAAGGEPQGLKADAAFPGVRRGTPQTRRAGHEAQVGKTEGDRAAREPARYYAGELGVSSDRERSRRPPTPASVRQRDRDHADHSTPLPGRRGRRLASEHPRRHPQRRVRGGRHPPGQGCRVPPQDSRGNSAGDQAIFEESAGSIQDPTFRRHDQGSSREAARFLNDLPPGNERLRRVPRRAEYDAPAHPRRARECDATRTW